MALAMNNSTFASASGAVVSAYPFTLGGWFRVPNVAASLPLMGLQDSTGDARYYLYYAGHSGGKVVANAFLGDHGRAISASAMTPEAWQHVAGVFHSNTLREVYLDGVLQASNTADRAFVGDDYVYCGNKDTSSSVEVAEAIVAATALDAEQIAALADGCSPRAIVGLANLRLYQDCLARLNRPGVGPTLSSGSAPTKVVHPRVVAGAGCGMTAAAYRVAGPWMRDASLLSAAGADPGQSSAGGADDAAAAVFAEVTS